MVSYYQNMEILAANKVFHHETNTGLSLSIFKLINIMWCYISISEINLHLINMKWTNFLLISSEPVHKYELNEHYINVNYICILFTINGAYIFLTTRNQVINWIEPIVTNTMYGTNILELKIHLLLNLFLLKFNFIFNFHDSPLIFLFLL